MNLTFVRDAVRRPRWKHREIARNELSAYPRNIRAFDAHRLTSNRLNMIHKIPAMKKNMPRNGGTTLRMRRYNPLATAMVPLGNTGVTPPAQVLTAVDKLYVHVKFLVIS
jgi:hypothetical protein